MTIRCPVYLDIDLGTENEMAEMTAERQAPQQNESNTSPKRRVCFVCTGNTCRSPMAEAVTNALARKPLQLLPEAVGAMSTFMKVAS